MRCILPGLLAFGLLEAAAEPQLVFAPGKTMGINPPPAELNAWQGRDMTSVVRPAPSEYASLDRLDFFAQEYGRPLEPFEFATGTNGWSRLWGSRASDRETCAIRFGRGWDDRPCSRYRMELTVEQDVPETVWGYTRHMRLGYGGRRDKEFRVKGKGLRVHYEDFGPITLKAQHQVNGFELFCLTTGAHVRVRSLKIVPYEYRVQWRRRFTLGDRPFRGGISHTRLADCTLKVNGAVVFRGNGITSAGIARADITSALRQGENEIVFEGNFNESYGPSRTFRAEAFAVAPDGTVSVFPGDGQWEWRTGTGEWRKPELLGRSGLDRQPNGNVISDSSFPLHAGALDPKPENGTPYPLFDGAKGVEWSVRLPPLLKDVRVDAVVRDALSRNEVARREFAGSGGAVRCALPVRDSGAYLVEWTLVSDGKTVDRLETEMVVTGKLDLPTFGPGEIDAAADRCRREIQRIDCTRRETNPTNFLDHSCYFLNPRLDAGRVARLPSGTYRETGDVRGDLFAYALKVGSPGKPHFLEFDYPDDGERMIYCAIVETFPMNFCNNMFPVGSRGWPNATGAVRCGGVMPVSGRKRTERILFFPGSRNISVYFENGLTGTRAAVSEIRVYEADDLPALALPETARAYGNHNERPLMHNWGAFVTPRIHEYDGEAKVRLWTAAYWSVVNRIRQLRFCGLNASIEGGYMYGFGYPSERLLSSSTATDFDYNRLILMMYRANGIRAFLSYEYTCAPDVSVSGARSVGDRENWEGTAQPADQVDRYGRQITGHGEAVNFLHPAVWGSMTNVLDELYARYADIGAVEGVVVQTGWLWQPCFGNIRRDVTVDEVGYDDLTVSAFERDTGISLGLPRTGRERFGARYRLLTGTYRTEWTRWRNEEVKRRLDRMREVVRTDSRKWELWVSPSLEHGGVERAFASADGTFADRRRFYADALVSSACDPSLFDDGADGAKLLPKIDYAKELDLADYGVLFNSGTRETYGSFDSLYLALVGLNEHIGTRVPLAKAWWWRSNGVAVFETKPAGENALYDVAQVIAGHTPRRFFHTWLDVNIPTGSAAEERRAAVGYYLVPDGPRREFPAVSGVRAWRSGDRVQFVNATPYRLEGRLRSRLFSAEELARGRRFRGEVTWEIPPFGMQTVRVPFSGRLFSGEFAFDAHGAEIVAAQERVIADPRVVRRLPEKFRTLLAAERRPYYRAELLRDFEALNAVELALGKDGLADYVNGRIPERHVTAIEKTFLSWKAGDANSAVTGRWPDPKVRSEDGVSFVRVPARQGFSLADGTQTEHPGGAFAFTSRVRVRGKGGFLQVFGPWRSRFDLRIEGGKVRPGTVNWPVTGGRYQEICTDPRFALPAGDWFDLAVEVDPEGEAQVFADGVRLARVNLVRLHGEKRPACKVSLSGQLGGEDVEIDISEIRVGRIAAMPLFTK